MLKITSKGVRSGPGVNKNNGTGLKGFSRDRNFFRDNGAIKTYLSRSKLSNVNGMKKFVEYS